MVISQKPSEKNVGYRGSKLVILKIITVKEQRVYGSCRSNNLRLRSTLTGFERNFQINNLFPSLNTFKFREPALSAGSNLIIHKRLYSKSCKGHTGNNLTVNNKHTLIQRECAQFTIEP